LSFDSISDLGLKNLPALPALGKIDISDTEVTSAGLTPLLRLKELTSLEISCALTADGLTTIRKLPKISELHINWTDLSDESERQLGSLDSLRTLHLMGLKVRDETLSQVVKIRSGVCVLWDYG